MFMSLNNLVAIIEFSRDCARPVHFHLILESAPLGINHASVYFYSISDLVFDNDMWWTPLTSHDRAEIDHIRLVIFQIRVGKDSESEGSTRLCRDCLDLRPTHKII